MLNRIEQSRRLLMLGLVGWVLSVQAMADVVVVVNKSNTDNLSAEQVQNLFLGKAKYFPNGKPALAIQLKETAPAYQNFAKEYLHKDANQLRAYWSRLVFTGRASPPREVKDSAEVLQLVSTNPNLIGYVDNSDVHDFETVRLVKIQ